jgi:hypothetical protein
LQCEEPDEAPVMSPRHAPLCAAEEACTTQAHTSAFESSSSACRHFSPSTERGASGRFATSGACPNKSVRSDDGVCANSDGTYGPGHWNRPNPQMTAWWSTGGKRVLPGVWLHVSEYSGPGSPAMRNRGSKLTSHSHSARDFGQRVRQDVGAGRATHELLLSGLSRWAPHQLDGELSRGDWWLCYPEPWEVVSLPPEHMWDTLARHALQVK